MRRAEGFTLIELMVAATVMLVATVYVVQTFTVNHQAYVVVDQVTESQQNVRAIAGLIEQDVRQAGMLVPEAAALCAIDDTANSDVLAVSDADAIDPGDDLAGYEGVEIVGASNLAANSTITLESLAVEPAVRFAYDTNGDGTADSDFRPGAAIIVIDLLDDNRGVSCGLIDSIDIGNKTLDITDTSGPLGTAGGSARLVAVPANVYWVDNGQLFRNSVVLADGVEDLQLSFFFDLDGDNLVDTGEMLGTYSGAAYNPATSVGEALRAVQLNLATRTRLEDPDYTQGQFQELENRNFTGTGDGYRRRTYSSTIRLRNVGDRGA